VTVVAGSARTTVAGLADLLRVANLPTVWTNTLVGVLLCGAPFDAGATLLLGAALSAFYLGGMALNDYWDRDWDGRHRRQRPLPSGRVSPAAAAAASWLLLALPFPLLLLAPRPAGLAAAGVLLACIIAYDRFHKRHRRTVVAMAACRLLAPVLPTLALTGRVVPPVAVAAAAQSAYVLLLTVVARRRAGRGRPEDRRRRAGPVSWLIAGICAVDGVLLALLAAPPLLAVGLAGALLSRLGQVLSPGD